MLNCRGAATCQVLYSKVQLRGLLHAVAVRLAGECLSSRTRGDPFSDYRKKGLWADTAIDMLQSWCSTPGRPNVGDGRNTAAYGNEDMLINIDYAFMSYLTKKGINIGS